MLSEYAINVEWFVHSNEGTRKIYYFEIFFGHKIHIYIYEKNLCPSLKCDQNAELKIT